MEGKSLTKRERSFNFKLPIEMSEFQMSGRLTLKNFLQQIIVNLPKNAIDLVRFVAHVQNLRF